MGGGQRGGIDLSGVPVHEPSPLRIQAKLTVGHSDDPLEHEADRIADQVMRMPDPQAPANGERGAAKSSKAPVPTIQTKSASDTAGFEAPPIVHEVLRSPGQPLDAATRAFFEPRFGRDFGHARIHSGSQAARAAEAINAHAFSVGRNIVFGADTYRPSTSASRSLIAHELAHTIQQDGTIRRQEKEEHTGQQKSVKYQFKIAKGDISASLTIEPEIGSTETQKKGSKYLKYIGLGSEKKYSVEGKNGSEAWELKAAAEVSAYLRMELADVHPASGLNVKLDLDALPISFSKGKVSAKLLKLKFSIQGTIADRHDKLCDALIPDKSLFDEGSRVKITVKGEYSVPPEFYERILKRKIEKIAKNKASKEAEQALLEDATAERRRAFSQAKARARKIKADIARSEQEARSIKSSKRMNPETASEKVKQLEEEVAQHKRDLEEAERALLEEKRALEGAKEASQAGKKATKKALRELGKDARAAEYRLAKYQRITKKLSEKIAKQKEALERLSLKAIRATARWLEKTAAKIVGERLAKMAAEAVAKLITRAIPVIGELLLIYDAVTMLWDIGSVLWNWIKGETSSGGDGGDSEHAGTDDVEQGAAGGAGTGGPSAGNDAGTMTQDDSSAESNGGAGSQQKGADAGSNSTQGGPQGYVGGSQQRSDSTKASGTQKHEDSVAEEHEDSDEKNHEHSDVAKNHSPSNASDGGKTKSLQIGHAKHTAADSNKKKAEKKAPDYEVKNLVGKKTDYVVPEKPITIDAVSYTAPDLPTGKLVKDKTYTFTLNVSFRYKDTLVNVATNGPAEFKFLGSAGGVATFSVLEHFTLDMPGYVISFKEGVHVHVTLH